MPNHCYNRVQLNNNAENDSKQFDELVAKFESQTPFAEILPMPDFSKIKNEDGELPVVREHKNDNYVSYWYSIAPLRIACKLLETSFRYDSMAP